MDSSLWTQHLRRRLEQKLARLQGGNYATAISENLTVVLKGFVSGWTPEQVAKEIYAIELAAMGLKNVPLLPK
jgi:hypothetical protein